jgi:hypothetical protein
MGDPEMRLVYEKRARKLAVKNLNLKTSVLVLLLPEMGNRGVIINGIHKRTAAALKLQLLKNPRSVRKTSLLHVLYGGLKLIVTVVET